MTKLREEVLRRATDHHATQKAGRQLLLLFSDDLAPDFLVRGFGKKFCAAQPITTRRRRLDVNYFCCLAMIWPLIFSYVALGIMFFRASSVLVL